MSAAAKAWQFDAQGPANTVWAVGTSKLKRTAFLAVSGQHAAVKLQQGECGGQSPANLLWSFTTATYKPEFLLAATPEMCASDWSSKMSPQGLANWLWSPGVPVCPDILLLHVAAATAEDKILELEPQHMANAAQACSTVSSRHRLPVQATAALAKGCTW